MWPKSWIRFGTTRSKKHSKKCRGTNPGFNSDRNVLVQKIFDVDIDGADEHEEGHKDDEDDNDKDDNDKDEKERWIWRG